MTRAEWVEIVRRINANWPHSRMPDASLAKFYADLTDLPASTVAAAVEAVFRAGREFAPTSAHLLAEIADQTDSAPTFGEAWAQIVQAIRTHGSHHPAEVVAALEHPAVRELAAMVSIRDLGLAPDGDTTWHAQARERYAGIVRRRRRALTHGELPSAALPQLRGDGHDPRPIGTAIAELVSGLHNETGEAS